MNFLRKCAFILIICGLFARVYCQGNTGTLKLSLSEAQDYALQNNRTVQSAKIDIDIASRQIKENVGIGLPQINLAANYQHQFVVPELNFGTYLDLNRLPDGVITKDDLSNAYVSSPPVPLGVRNNTTFDITVSQLIFSGEYLVGLQALKVVREVSEKALAKTEATTKETVAGTYFLILVLDESARVLGESLKSTEQTYNDMVQMNRQGLNEETDVDQIKYSLSNLRRLLTSVEAQKETSQKLLKYQLGMDFSQPIELTDSLQGLIKEGNMNYLTSPSFNVENSIDYKIISDQVEISSILLKREQSKYLPTISAFYRRHEQTNQPSFNFAVKDLVGASLTFPIFTSGQRSSQVGQARFNLEKSELSKIDAEQGLRLEFETALNDYKTAFSNYVTNSESIVLSKKVYDKTLIKYHEGVSSSFELSQNQNQYLTAEGTYYNSILSLLNARAKLDRILGNY